MFNLVMMALGLVSLVIVGSAQVSEPVPGETTEMQEPVPGEAQPDETPPGAAQPEEPAPPSSRFELDPQHPVQGETPIQAVPAPAPIDPVFQPLIDIVQQDLAARLSIAPWDIEVIDAQAVVWPNPGLGCPQPGMAYIQVPVDGALVRVRYQGKVYEYHSGGRRGPFLCDNPSKPIGPPPETPLPPPGGGEGV
jgi:hypothetical protein